MESDRSSAMTRRTLMRLAAAALPTGVVRAAQPASAVMTRLSIYMSEARERALPADVIEKVKHHILDTFAAMISGSELAPGRSAIQFARAYGGEKIATVAASSVLCGPIEAAPGAMFAPTVAGANGVG